MRDETSIGGPRGAFPATRLSAVAALRGDDPAARERALEAIAAAYWKPIYKYLRLRWRRSNEEAKDLTQELFARLIGSDTLARYDPAKGRLRTYLRACADRLVHNQGRAASRLKRGGGAPLLALDFAAAEAELTRIAPPAEDAMETFFEREWMRSLFALAVEALAAECAARGKRIHFRAFERYDLEGAEDGKRPTYAELAAELGVAASDVTNRLAWARRRFRHHLLAGLREMTGSEEEYRREARALLGEGAA